MEVCKVLLYAILEILVVHSALIARKVTDDEINWRKHTSRVAKFQCSVPQPRSLSFKDFIDRSKWPAVDANVLPAWTVLHRCDSQSGCCANQDKVCIPVEVEDVTLTFKIVTILENYKTKHEYETVVATNHTKCACDTAYSRPK